MPAKCAMMVLVHACVAGGAGAGQGSGREVHQGQGQGGAGWHAGLCAGQPPQACLRPTQLAHRHPPPHLHAEHVKGDGRRGGALRAVERARRGAGQRLGDQLAHDGLWSGAAGSSCRVGCAERARHAALLGRRTAAHPPPPLSPLPAAAAPHLQRDDGGAHAQQVEVAVSNHGPCHRAQRHLLRQQRCRPVPQQVGGGWGDSGTRHHARPPPVGALHSWRPAQPPHHSVPCTARPRSAPAGGPAWPPRGCRTRPGRWTGSRTRCQTGWQCR